MFSRGVLEDLAAWAGRPDRKPLVLRGARQVGKTFAVRLFADSFDRFIEMNLDLDEDANIFRRGLSVDDVWEAILLTKKAASPRPGERVLLFLDEIQSCPEAVAQLRYFHEEKPDLFVIAAGSLLDAMLSAQSLPFPLGRVDYLLMRPLSFWEFLVATGESQALAAIDAIPCPDYAQPALLTLFQRYALLGGMPEVIERYARGRQIAALEPVYRSLLTGYLDDVAKYARNDTMRAVIRHCIEVAPFEAGKRIVFAGFGQSNYRSREIGEALRTLERAMVITLVRPSLSTAIPIQPDFRKHPRLQFLDTGLVNYVVGLQEQFFAHTDLHGIYRGLLVEHIVGQQLLADMHNPMERLCFWVRDKPQAQAEVDFLLRYGSDIVPVEVKAGASGTLRSLHQFIEASGVAWGVRLHAGALGVEKLATPRGRPFKLLNLPYYLAGKLREHLQWAQGS